MTVEHKLQAPTCESLDVTGVWVSISFIQPLSPWPKPYRMSRTVKGIMRNYTLRRYYYSRAIGAVLMVPGGSNTATGELLPQSKFCGSKPKNTPTNIETS